MIAIGINQGMQSIIGYNYVSKNYVRVKKTFIYAVKIAKVITSVGFILSYFMPDVLIRAFSCDVDLVAISAMVLGYTTSSFVFVDWQMVTTSFFQFFAIARFSILLNLIRQLLRLLPSIYILPLFFNLNDLRDH